MVINMYTKFRENQIKTVVSTVSTKTKEFEIPSPRIPGIYFWNHTKIDRGLSCMVINMNTKFGENPIKTVVSTVSTKNCLRQNHFEFQVPEFQEFFLGIIPKSIGFFLGWL